jgi:hypothetical protein
VKKTTSKPAAKPVKKVTAKKPAAKAVKSQPAKKTVKKTTKSKKQFCGACRGVGHNSRTCKL